MISISRYTVGTTQSFLTMVPPGPSSVTITVPGSAATVYLGTGSGTVTATTGFPVPAGGSPIVFQGYPTSSPTTINAISSGTATTVWVTTSNAS